MPKDKVMMAEHMDAHGLLLELQQEREKLVDQNLTHVSIGFAADNKVVKVVELLSQRACSISQIMSNEEEGVRVNGQMLSKTVGLYAARIVAASRMDKEIAIVGPPQMQMVKQTMEFIINFPGPLDDIFHSQDQKYLEIYVSTRGNFDKIAYGKPDNERINVKHLQLAYRLKCDIYPDPRTEIEDAKDREDYEAAKAAE